MPRPTSSTSLRSAFVAVAALLVAGPAVAHAEAPSPKSKAIVPLVSIGGVKLGASYADALRVWGPGSDCADEDADAAATSIPVDRTTYLGSCTWRDTSKESKGPALGSAELFFKDGKVRRISLSPEQNAKYFPTSKGPIGKYKVKGTTIGMGSSIATVMKKLRTRATGSGVEVAKGGKYLGFASSGGHVAGISLGFLGDS
ncbi:MAG: hypothetical protein PGN13_07495 [Patulibacter minatonensis]